MPPLQRVTGDPEGAPVEYSCRWHVHLQTCDEAWKLQTSLWNITFIKNTDINL